MQGGLEENPCLLTPSPALFASKRNLEFSLVLSPSRLLSCGLSKQPSALELPERGRQNTCYL